MRLLVASVLLAASLACGPHAAVMKKEALAKRASFDFDCPKDKLTFTPLDAEEHNESYAPLFWHMVGVNGCDKKAVYLYQSEHGHDLWVLNTGGKSQIAEPADSPAPLLRVKRP